MDISRKEQRAFIIASEYDGIAPMVEGFYILSILYSASRSLDAFHRYDEVDKKEENAELLISSIQEAVGHAASLSRYFWPSPHSKKRRQQNLNLLREKRGERLRRAFKLDESSPLSNRDLRNAWEHFDERLDEYFLEHDIGCFFPTCRLGSHMLVEESVSHIFKLLDVEEECLVLMGEKFFYGLIREEVVRIEELARGFDATGRLT